MVDVKTFECFPTLIHSFALKINHEPMITSLRSTENKDQLFLLPSFNSLVDGIIEATTQVLKKLEYSYDKIEITNMWANEMKSGDVHPPHTHSNNFLSGVYYLNSDAETGIIFQDPRPAADVLVPRKKTKTNENSNLLSYISKTNRLIIFPSWLLHWVPINESNRNRISISFNVQIKGQVGEHHEYQSGQF